VTFDPQAHAVSSKHGGVTSVPKQKRKRSTRRGSLASTSNDLQEDEDDADASKKRYSRRRSTIANTSRTAERVEELEARKARNLWLVLECRS
jgi:hypothetical protein